MTERDYPTDPLAKGGVREDPDALTCSCPDDQAHEVAALVEGGMGQWQASRIVYSERAALSRSIVASFMAKFPDLRLPGVTS